MISQSVQSLPTDSRTESPVIDIRTGQPLAPLGYEEFTARFRAAFMGPATHAGDQPAARLDELAWAAYAKGQLFT